MHEAVDLNAMTDEILIKIFIYLDFKTKHNSIPLVCKRWATITKSNELWKTVTVDPIDECSVLSTNTPLSQSKVFRWCSQSHVRPHISELHLKGIGSDMDDFTPVGMAAMFGICNAALNKLKIQATRELLQDLSCLLCLINITDLSIECTDPDPHNPFHGVDVQCISGLRMLERLVLEINLVLVPGDFGNLRHLKSFSVSGTGSISLILPNELSELTSLESFNIKEPLWPEVPMVVYNLVNLRKLEIQGHPQFAHNLGFSDAASTMTNLRHLGIVAHRLQRTPEEIGDMIFLKELDLSWNNFDERLPIDVMFPFSKLTRLETLNLSNCGLKQVPEIISFLLSLISLDLSYNPFKQISASLSKCAKLRILKLKGCGLESIPTALPDIPNLEHLDISDNYITAMDSIKALIKKNCMRCIVFRQEKWTPELVMSACKISRIWGTRDPLVL